MGFISPCYIKLEETTFTEMIDGSSLYIARCKYSVFTDETKSVLLCTKEFEVGNLSLDDLNLGKIYQYLMKEFKNPTFL